MPEFASSDDLSMANGKFKHPFSIEFMNNLSPSKSQFGDSLKAALGHDYRFDGWQIVRGVVDPTRMESTVDVDTYHYTYAPHDAAIVIEFFPTFTELTILQLDGNDYVIKAAITDSVHASIKELVSRFIKGLYANKAEECAMEHVGTGRRKASL